MKLQKYNREVKKLKKYLTQETQVFKTFNAFEKFFIFFGEFCEELSFELNKSSIKEKKPHKVKKNIEK